MRFSTSYAAKDSSQRKCLSFTEPPARPLMCRLCVQEEPARIQIEAMGLLQIYQPPSLALRGGSYKKARGGWEKDGCDTFRAEAGPGDRKEERSPSRTPHVQTWLVPCYWYIHPTALGWAYTVQ